jgi:lambda family phage minor tail protein L
MPLVPELASMMQNLALGELVTMFELDLSPIGVATSYYFSPTNLGGAKITHNTIEYDYAGIDISGVEWSADGTPSNPVLRIPNMNQFGSALIVSNNDVIGAKVIRTRTFSVFLDGESLADPDALISREVFIVEQKSMMNNELVEFTLKPIYDIGKRQLPGRVCLKGVCTHRYRIWDADLGDWDYSKATCPYVGATMYDRNNDVTVVSTEDACAKDIAACKLRFGATAVLPTRAFPGMSRIRL